MSAFVITPHHAGVLVAAAIADGRERDAMYHRFPDQLDGFRRCRPEDADYLGGMLMATCRASVAYRYDESPDADLPGPQLTPDDEYDHSLFRPTRTRSVAEIAKAVDGYEYQSCERPDLEHSEAAHFCGSLRKSLLKGLPGYEDADWVIPTPRRSGEFASIYEDRQ